MRLDELRRLNKLLTDASDPWDVFMALRDRSLQGDAQRLALAGEHRRLESLANPERFMGNPPAQDLAREIVARLGELYQTAIAALDAGTAEGVVPAEVVLPAEVTPPEDPPPQWRASEPVRVGEPAGFESAGFELVAGANRYRLEAQVGIGDLATIFRGRCTAGARVGAEVAAKLAIDRADNSFILAEIQALRLLQQGDGRQRGQLPELLDLFHGGEGQAGVVLGWIDGFDGEALRGRFPEGVPPEHVIWIGRRLLSVVGHAHKLGVLHANIEPAHIIVRPRDHHVSLIDWCYCVIEPARTHQGFRVYNPDFSAPEVAEKKAPLPAADLYSVGRCMLYLCGGDMASGAMPGAVDDRLQRFIRYLTRQSPLQRAQDAWEMFSELERVRAAVYGAHRFVEMVVP
ncbi:hypothetical protein [Nannocystis sp.]|uniref:protein kinase domain-containing protein n=1 Tax=Nannocystis sp. TaxID=1962667 RepID=UPI0025E80BE7|nr:hypothetical protein [Nannocystis sp.]MBK7828985.1 hypothetical protein [Nannocystis sp.]